MSRWLACLIAVVSMTSTMSTYAAEWSIPFGGNAFPTDPSAHHDDTEFLRGGTVKLKSRAGACSLFFHVDRPAQLDLALTARAPTGDSRVTVRTQGQEWTVPVSGLEPVARKLGPVEIPTAGYVRVDVTASKDDGEASADLSNLVVTSATKDLVLDYVKTNKDNMFYWGRRGPSVHLSHVTPKDTQLRYAYTEIMVPRGQDVIGSYYMANGFSEGYFGIQVNSASERRVLFSVWSPFSTDNPRDIPEDQRIKCLGSGPDVRIGEFGNEGSGGQSFLVYPWKAAITYSFLTEVLPDSPMTTVYTCWFREKGAEKWRLVASFRRPKTHTNLRGFHSFLENFNPEYGHITRGAQWGNVWVGDVDGKWHECSQARFSVDATGGGRHRLDFLGGTDASHFFLKNCGFFPESGKPGDVFTRKTSPDDKPVINVDSLPRK